MTNEFVTENIDNFDLFSELDPGLKELVRWAKEQPQNPGASDTLTITYLKEHNNG